MDEQDLKTASPNLPAKGDLLKFPSAIAVSAPRPTSLQLTFSWEMLEEQLNQLAATDTQRNLVSTLVSATRKQAQFKPPELVLREVLSIASVLMDETFHPVLEEGEMS